MNCWACQRKTKLCLMKLVRWAENRLIKAALFIRCTIKSFLFFSFPPALAYPIPTSMKTFTETSLLSSAIGTKCQLSYTTLGAVPHQAFLGMIFTIRRLWAHDGFPHTSDVLTYCPVCKTLSYIITSTAYGASAKVTFPMMPKLVLPHLIKSLFEIEHLHMGYTIAGIPLFQLPNKVRL